MTFTEYLKDMDPRDAGRLLLIWNALKKVESAVKVAAIDGRCASGKTTLAEQLAGATGAGVIHMDDFFLPEELRSEERLRESGGNVHYERFLEEVLPIVRSGLKFDYRRYDCSRMEPGEKRWIPAGNLRIVEGAYSCHPKFGDYMDLRVFCDVPPLEQRRRIRLRNGEDALPVFLGRWIPMEEKYFSAYHIRECADIIV